MYLKKFTDDKPITIDYDKNGVIKTLKGQVNGLNLKDQILCLKDEQQRTVSIKLSCIRNIH